MTFFGKRHKSKQICRNKYACIRLGRSKPLKKLVLYVHGKGGSAAESEHYQTLFPACEVTGLDYQTFPRGKPALRFARP